MSLPANWSTVTVTGTYLNVDGDPLKGTVAFSTTTRVVDAAANVTVPPGVRQVSLDKDGKFSLVLPATDDPDVAPTGFTYRVDENLVLPSGVRALANYLILLPAATPTVDLADVVPVTAVAEVSPYLRAVDLGTVVETPAGAQAKASTAQMAAQAASASRAAAFQWGHRWAFIGDSITNGSAAANFAWSYTPRAAELAGYNLIRPDSFEAGVPGERSDQMLARLAAVETSGATSFFVLAGTNDAAQGVSVTSYASTMTQIITRLRALGRVLVGTVPPRGASDPAAYHASIEGYNAWLRTFAPMLGAQVVDVWTALADPTTGRLAAAYDSGDGTHPNTLGHLRIARVIAAAIRGSATPWQGWITSEAQPGNYIADALCDSGSVRPSGWFEWPSGTGTAPVYSLATDTTGRLPAGRWAQVDITAAAATYRILSSPAIPVTAGDRLALCLLAEVDDISGDWEATAGAATAWNARVVNQSGAAITSARPGRAVGYSVVAGTYRMPPLLWPFTLPAGTTSANVWLEHTLSAGQHYTFRYGCIGLVNLTTLGLQSMFDFGSNSMVSLA